MIFNRNVLKIKDKLIGTSVSDQDEVTGQDLPSSEINGGKRICETSVFQDAAHQVIKDIAPWEEGNRARWASDCLSLLHWGIS